jgi:hypothetical protein
MLNRAKAQVCTPQESEFQAYEDLWPEFKVGTKGLPAV